MLTKLEKLFIGEVSGVDDPANEAPGWMVMKAALAASASAGDASPVNAAEAAPTLKDRLALLFGKEDFGMTEETLKAYLDERDEALVEKLAAKLAPVAEAPAPEGEGAAATEKASEAPAPVVAPAVVEAVPAPVETVDIEKAVTEKVEAILEPLVKALDATLDRLAAVEARFATRQSIPAQDPAAGEEGVAKATNTVGAAITAAFGR